MGLFKRVVTVCIGAPLIMWLVSNQIIVLIWCATFVGMLEWTKLKRHLKVILLANHMASSKQDSLVVHLTEKDEYPFPVAKSNTFIILKCALCSLIAPCAAYGPSAYQFSLFIYFFGWVVLTLRFSDQGEQTIQEAKRCIAQARLKKKVDSTLPASVPLVGALAQEDFSIREAEIMVAHPNTQLFLSFCLEYFGFVWISGLSYALLLFYHSGPYGFPFGFSMLLSNWANDAAALLAGKYLGPKRTHALYPRVSPAKSREGAIAGVIASGLTAGLMTLVLPSVRTAQWPVHPLPLFFVWGLIFGVVGVVGDLLQSLFKRAAQVKDAGNIVPGHGGFLDRMDGLLLVLPLSYWVCRLSFPIVSN